MIRRIELRNFMSHRHTVVELADGLTVLVGENNCGKSAVVIALQVLCQNVSGDFMVRHGEKECSVKVETDDGHVLEWRRKGGVVSYRIDGREIDRLRRSVPEDLHDHLRLPEVDTEDGARFDVHFGEQKKPIFLLDETSSRRAVFFASSSDSARLLEMQNLHRHNIREANAEERVLIKRLADLEREKERLSGVEELASALEDGELRFAALEESLRNIGALRALRIRLGQSSRDTGLLRQKTRALESLAAPPELRPSSRLREIIMRVREMERRIHRQNGIARATGGLVRPPEMADTAALRLTARNLDAAKTAAATAHGVRRRVERIPPLPKLAPVTELARICAQMRDAFRIRVSQEKVANEARARQVQAVAALRDVAAKIKACPTCGQTLDPDRLVAAAAGIPAASTREEDEFELELEG